MSRRQYHIEIDGLPAATLLMLLLMLLEMPILGLVVGLWPDVEWWVIVIIGAGLMPPLLIAQLKPWETRLWVWPKRMQLEVSFACRTQSKGENWADSLGWFIPRKYRKALIGDILEDCAEMREAGCTERRVKFQVVYQWLIAVITLVPTAVKTSITDILKQVISPPK